MIFEINAVFLAEGVRKELRRCIEAVKEETNFDVVRIALVVDNGKPKYATEVEVNGSISDTSLLTEIGALITENSADIVERLKIPDLNRMVRITAIPVPRERPGLIERRVARPSQRGSIAYAGPPTPFVQ